MVREAIHDFHMYQKYCVEKSEQTITDNKGQYKEECQICTPIQFQQKMP